MNLPGFLLRHTMTVEPHLGVTATGPAYGPPRVVRCFVEAARNTIRTPDKRIVTGASVIRCGLDPTLSAQDRVTVAGRPVEVVAMKHFDGGGLPTPDHTEITVT